MALAAPKVSLHLYLNNPYGLLSAVVPHYSINAVNVPSEFPKKYETLPTIQTPKPEPTKEDEASDNSSAVSSHAMSNEKADVKKVPKKNSPRGKVKPHGPQVQTSKALGITWSQNLDNRERVVLPRKSPPPSLIESIARKKLPEPVGIIKIKRDESSPTSYNIQRLQLADKQQRKMTERLSVWLDQYNEISQKQQAYLSRIHDLRKSLQNKDEKRVIVTIDNMRSFQKHRYRRKYPLYTMSKMEDTAAPKGPAPFPSRPSLFHAEDGKKEQKVKMAPRSSPRKLVPIIKKVDTHRVSKMADIGLGDSTPRPGINKMKTEYEPFESIARRNKLSLTQFFNSSLSHRRSNRRQPLNVSTVTIINEVAEENLAENASPVEFITDVSSKKCMSNKGKDVKPE